MGNETSQSYVLNPKFSSVPSCSIVLKPLLSLRTASKVWRAKDAWDVGKNLWWNPHGNSQWNSADFLEIPNWWWIVLSMETSRIVDTTYGTFNEIHTGTHELCSISHRHIPIFSHLNLVKPPNFACWLPESVCWLFAGGSSWVVHMYSSEAHVFPKVISWWN